MRRGACSIKVARDRSIIIINLSYIRKQNVSVCYEINSLNVCVYVVYTAYNTNVVCILWHMYRMQTSVLHSGHWPPSQCDVLCRVRREITILNYNAPRFASSRHIMLTFCHIFTNTYSGSRHLLHKSIHVKSHLQLNL